MESVITDSSRAVESSGAVESGTTELSKTVVSPFTDSSTLPENFMLGLANVSIKSADKKDQKCMHVEEEKVQPIDDSNLFNEQKFANEEHLDQKRTLTPPVGQRDFEKEDQANARAEGYTDLNKEFLNKESIAAISGLRMADELNKKRMALEEEDQAKQDDYLARENEKTLQLEKGHLEINEKISHAQGQYLELVQTTKRLYRKICDDQTKLYTQQRSLRVFKRELNDRVRKMKADHDKIFLEFQAERDRLCSGIATLKKLEAANMDGLMHLCEMSLASAESTQESEGGDGENGSLSGWSLVEEPGRDAVAPILSSSFLEEETEEKVIIDDACDSTVQGLKQTKDTVTGSSSLQVIADDKSRDCTGFVNLAS